MKIISVWGIGYRATIVYKGTVCEAAGFTRKEAAERVFAMVLELIDNE